MSVLKRHADVVLHWNIQTHCLWSVRLLALLFLEVEVKHDQSLEVACHVADEALQALESSLGMRKLLVRMKPFLVEEVDPTVHLGQLLQVVGLSSEADDIQLLLHAEELSEEILTFGGHLGQLFQGLL